MSQRLLRQTRQSGDYNKQNTERQGELIPGTYMCRLSMLIYITADLNRHNRTFSFFYFEQTRTQLVKIYISQYRLLRIEKATSSVGSICILRNLVLLIIAISYVPYRDYYTYHESPRTNIVTRSKVNPGRKLLEVKWWGEEMRRKDEWTYTRCSRRQFDHLYKMKFRNTCRPTMFALTWMNSHLLKFWLLICKINNEINRQTSKVTHQRPYCATR